MKFIILITTIVAMTAQARITDSQFKIAVKSEQIEISTNAGFHLNDKAPAGIIFEDVKNRINPQTKTEKLFIFLKNNNAQKAKIDFFVCDDKKTVCEKHEKQINLKTGELSKDQALASAEKIELKDYNKISEFNLKSADGRPTLLVFSAPWCPACIRMQTEVYPKPAVDIELQKINFIKLNSDLTENFELSEKFNIKAIPTLILLNAAGEEVYRWLDYQPHQIFSADLKKQITNVNKYENTKNKALALNENAIFEMGTHSFNALDYKEAAKWFSLGKTKKNHKYKLASEVGLAETDSDSFAALEKGMALSTSRIDRLRWTLDWLDKKNETKTVDTKASEIVLKKTKEAISEALRLVKNKSSLSTQFKSSTYGDYTGYEEIEIRWMLSKLYQLSSDDKNIKNNNIKTIKLISQKQLSVDKPGEMLNAISYLREAQAVDKATSLYDLLIKKYPNSYVYFEKYSRFEQKQKNYDKALTLVEEALTYPMGNIPQLSLLKAQILKDQNKIDQARRVVENALNDPEVTHKKLARTYKKLQELKAELVKLEK